MLTKNDPCLQIDVFLENILLLKMDILTITNIKVIMFNVLNCLHKILSLELKIRTFSKSTFPWLLKNVLNFNHMWLWRQVMVVQTFCKLFFYSRFIKQMYYENHQQYAGEITKWWRKFLTQCSLSEAQLHKCVLLNIQVMLFGV